MANATLYSARKTLRHMDLTPWPRPATIPTPEAVCAAFFVDTQHRPERERVKVSGQILWLLFNGCSTGTGCKARQNELLLLIKQTPSRIRARGHRAVEPTMMGAEVFIPAHLVGSHLDRFQGRQ